SSATVLELTRPALRLLRKLPKFGQSLDATYRAHGQSRVLEDVRHVTRDVLSRELLTVLGAAAKFMVYGKHHALCQEGQPVEKIILIKDGWVRRVRGIFFDPSVTSLVMGASVELGVDFLGAGNCLGLEGAAKDTHWRFSASVMARTEVLEISIAKLREDPTLLGKVLQTFSGFSSVDDAPPTAIESVLNMRTLVATEEEITTGIVDSTNLLVMDMDLCVRCGNCSFACHQVHGQSRLLRRGIHIERPTSIESSLTQHVLSPQVCMHCKDPECLTGCPTGAIFRDPSGQVDIDPKICIGCFDCATQCPYDAITMTPRSDEPSAPFDLFGRVKNFFSLKPAEISLKPVEGSDMVAIKCNLCEHTPLNPQGARTKAYSCEENCPTGALVRVNPKEYFEEIEQTLGIIFRDKTHAVGRNIHKSDPLAVALHIFGALAAFVLTVATLAALLFYGQSARLFNTWLTMRWVTGIAGLLGIVAVMLYPVRKKIYRRRAGALRYWMLAHIYLGILAAIVLLLHSGIHTGGLLTTALYVIFNLVIATGLFGVACYQVAPRIMTSIEGEPLLIEDLVTRRKELRDKLDEIKGKVDEGVRRMIDSPALKRFFKVSYLLRQYLRREELKALLAEARGEIKPLTDSLSEAQSRKQLIDAAETIVTLRRVESLVYLHRLLKIWIAPHVITTSLMLALLIVHILQAVFFSFR
ncbi:MAG: 4Fe-4S dicluster domain-containing protein, partial [Pyrinomonadaceae bacterium]